MISSAIIESDRFYSLTPSSQVLYVHLVLHADDDGFVDMWKTLARCLGIRQLHIESLIKEGYVIIFDDNLLLISDWLIHNKIRLDRYSEGRYKDRLKTVVRQPNGRYIKASETFLSTQDK